MDDEEIVCTYTRKCVRKNLFPKCFFGCSYRKTQKPIDKHRRTTRQRAIRHGILKPPFEVEIVEK